MKKKKAIHFKILYGIAVVLFVLFSLGPIMWSFIMSITPQVELVGNTTKLLPMNPTLDNYKTLLTFGSQEGELFRGNVIYLASYSSVIQCLQADCLST